ESLPRRLLPAAARRPPCPPGGILAVCSRPETQSRVDLLAPPGQAVNRRRPSGWALRSPRCAATMPAGGHRQPADSRDEPLPPAARAQPGRVVSVGRGGVRAGQKREQADPPLGRLLRL